MATHSSVLSGKSHSQKSLVGYKSWVIRVGHNLITKPPPSMTYDLGKIISK